MFHLDSWQDYAGLITGLLLIMALLWLFIRGVMKSAVTEDDDAWAAREQRAAKIREQDELTRMIKAAQAYESEQDRLRRIAEWEAQR
jgi:hypothetical protein